MRNLASFVAVYFALDYVQRALVQLLRDSYKYGAGCLGNIRGQYRLPVVPFPSTVLERCKHYERTPENMTSHHIDIEGHNKNKIIIWAIFLNSFSGKQ